MNKQIPVILPDGYMNFYTELENWQNQIQIRIKRSNQATNCDSLSLIESQQKPLINLIKFEIDPTNYQQIFMELITFLRKHRPENSIYMDSLQDHLEKLDFTSLPLKLLEDDQVYFEKLSKDLGLPTQLFIFVVDHALRPFLRSWAEHYYQVISGEEPLSWEVASQCPICGSKSHFSRLRSNDGRRFMFCDRCFSEWETRYLYCVHCGNAEPNTITYLTLENDPSHQLYTCDKCKGYLKTYDERQNGRRTDLFLANIETVYLDLLAKEKGFVAHD